MSGGKSYLLRWGALAYSLYLFTKLGLRGVAVGLFSEDYPTLKDRQISRIDLEFPKYLGILKEDKINGLIFQIAGEYGGGKILLRNLDDPSKYMSTEFAGEFVEELTRNDKDTFEALRNRLRYPGVDEVKFMGASNPGGIGHAWVKQYFIDKDSNDPEQERFFYVHANAYDNKYISSEYIKQLESLPEEKRKAYLYGSWDIFAGQYFTEWRHDLHVIKSLRPTKGDLIVGGMDWGRTHAFAFYLTVINKITHGESTFYRSRLFFEAWGHDKTPQEWAYEIKDKLSRYGLSLKDISWIRADPAIFTKQQDNSLSIADQFKNEGIYVQTASNDRIGGWEALHKWLSVAPDDMPYLQVTEDCPNFIRTFPSLVHDENKIEDLDTEGQDDSADSVRYLHKHLKWISGEAGAYIAEGPSVYNRGKRAANVKDGQQKGINLDSFGRSSTSGGATRVIGG